MTNISKSQYTDQAVYTADQAVYQIRIYWIGKLGFCQSAHP